MNKNIIKQVILEQLEVIEESTIIDRNYRFEKNMNYILVGLRRAGKSTLLYKIAKDLIKSGVDWSQIIYVNFEDDRLFGFQKEDFNDIVEVAYELAEGKEIYYFFDEIQIVDGWEHFARRMADQKKHVYITGSNAKMLSSEMEKVLGGRYLSKMIMPFSLAEVLDYLEIDHSNKALLTSSKLAKIKNATSNYINFGGFAEAQHLLDKREYIKSVYEKVLLGDISERENIKNQTALRLMVKKIAETVMHEISFNKLAGNIKATGIKTSTDSMIEYTSYAESAFLLFRTRNYVNKFSKKESTPRFYFYDNGLLNLFLVDKASALLENVVACHLKRLYGEDVYYFKSSKTGIDVDFYLPQKQCGVQVCYNLESAYERETKNLFDFMDKSENVSRLIIVTHDEEGTITEGNKTIEVIPVYKFLLMN
ncbi:ATP-binding protein [Lachnospira sp.]|jgi:predicted AAA+ superfamily ATPase|uniref:ATP-binding protein n=1 Tax=Lachnospira sp. TaxID=2049031 RepID=UPI00257E0742|nr:ATP-binding protein [Lachnospira sp.]